MSGRPTHAFKAIEDRPHPSGGVAKAAIMACGRKTTWSGRAGGGWERSDPKYPQNGEDVTCKKCLAAAAAERV